MDGGLVTTPMSSATSHGTVGVPSDVERRPNVTEDGCKIVDCRGIPLLAIPYNHVLYICVHEISMALWEKFDTPRVSVQKKITDLGIHLHQTTKAQVEILRRERIIGNFRATMITVRDAEKLYDALEYSRRKRGLVKHILKDPGKRAVRAEEFGARKLSLTVRHHQNGTPPPVAPSSRLTNAMLKQAHSSAIAISTSPPQPHRAHGSTPTGPRHSLPRDIHSPPAAAALVGCALNGTASSTGSPPRAAPRIKHHHLSASGKRISTLEGQEERCGYGDLLGLRFDVLFRAEDPEVLGGVAGCKDHYIELLQNNVSNKGIGSSGNRRSRNSPAGVPAVTIDDDGETESSAARVRVHTHMDRDSRCRHNLTTSTRDQAQTTTPNNHFVPRHPSGSKRRSKQHDPDYQPSAYAVKSTQRNLSSSSQSKRSSRNRERESLLSVASTSTGGSGRLNSLCNRHLSSPPLEFHELEEGSSVYSGVSGNSSRLQSLTPERFLFLDESSSEGEEYEYEQEEGGDRGGNSDMDSMFIVERLSSPEMRITVPGKGSSAPDKRIVKTKLRHFAQTTSPQITAKSRGKHLPLTLDDSPPTPTSPLSPLTVSISLDQIYSYQNQSTSALGTPYPPVANTSSFVQSQQSAGKMHKRGRGRPSKNKTRLAALSSFVMKKRASSPSSLAHSDASVVQPPPAKRARVGSESDSSANDGGTGGKSGIGEGGSSSLLTAKRHFRSATGTGSTNYYSILSSSRAPGPPVPHNTCDQSDPVETIDDTDEKTLNLQHQNSPNGYLDIQTQDMGDNGSSLATVNGGNTHQSLLDEDDRYSIASSTTFTPTATNQSSLTTSGKGKSQTSITPAAGGTTPAPPPPQRRGRPPKNPYSNGGNLNNELLSLTSTSKSSINFDKVFGYYPPKLVVKNGELQPERSLSIKRLERSAVNGLPDGHPFLSWNLGQPVKASVTLRGRGRKRKPPKAVHGTT